MKGLGSGFVGPGEVEESLECYRGTDMLRQWDV